MSHHQQATFNKVKSTDCFEELWKLGVFTRVDGPGVVTVCCTGDLLPQVRGILCPTPTPAQLEAKHADPTAAASDTEARPAATKTEDKHEETPEKPAGVKGEVKK